MRSILLLFVPSSSYHNLLISDGLAILKVSKRKG
uniref:Uncharacterized protein n=1 Tax=Arundo donax TaxID=35708 RepID=A0A0A9CC46_ARUDO